MTNDFGGYKSVPGYLEGVKSRTSQRASHSIGVWRGCRGGEGKNQTAKGRSEKIAGSFVGRAEREERFGFELELPSVSRNQAS